MTHSPYPIVLEAVPGRLAVARLEPQAAMPAWASLAPRPLGAAGAGAFLCVARTDQELSIVIDERFVPADVRVHRGYAAFRIAGVVEFGLIGIFARLTAALADAGVSVFVVSTFDTDYMLVKGEDRDRAIRALATVADVSGC